MTLKAFLFLFVVTLVAVVGAALIAEMLVGPGFERGIIIAVLAGLVVFPAARWAEYRGWMKGAWSPGGELRKQQEARREQPAPDATEERKQTATGEEPSLSATGDRTSPGDPR
ncbi:MAG: hypothetical protein H0T52_14150 [Lautropia sp.]|nr:hypothetical protein [Lautropia sp.]